MSNRTISTVKPLPKNQGISNQELATLIFLVTEVMFFMALFSAYLVIRSKTGNWVPPENVTLPIVATAINTIALVASGVLLFITQRNFKQVGQQSEGLKMTFLAAIGLGVWFVAYQGYEWFHLIKLGLTIASGLFGALFFVVIGSHAAHAIAGIAILVWLYSHYQKGTLKPEALRAAMWFWGLVVGVWPIIYWLVYLR